MINVPKWGLLARPACTWKRATSLALAVETCFSLALLAAWAGSHSSGCCPESETEKKRKKHNIRAHLLFSLIVSISELILIYCFDSIVSALPQSFCSEMNNKIEDNLPHHHVGRISSNFACHRLRSSTAWSRGGAWLYPDCGLWRMGWCQVGSSHLSSRALSLDPERDHPAVRSWSPPWVSNRGLIEYSIWK